MADFAGAIDEDAVVGSHAAVHGADVGRYAANFREGRRMDERGRGFLLGGKNDAICCCTSIGVRTFNGMLFGVDDGRRRREEIRTFNPEGCDTLVYGIEGIF